MNSHHDPDTRFLAVTHEVRNQPPPLENYNLFLSDRAARDHLQRGQADWAESRLTELGAQAGSAGHLELGMLANEHRPVFHSHDRFGHRIDEVRFHPAYHTLMRTSVEAGLHSSPWLDPRPGAHVARGLGFYLHSQVEAGHGCPITMTFSCIPALRKTPSLAAWWEPRITATTYDPANRPHTVKSGLTIGMAMTEKQGGSDVRANSTVAYPTGRQGAGEAYELVGHKYFVSAPMSDAFLVLAQAPEGLSCFLLPRWRPDGSKNPLQIQRLKNKMGNVSNASSETELRGALAWMLGEPGRGVVTIIEMVAMTRFDCMLGSAAGMRMATAQALHHASHRQAFGQRLWDQPLMRNVLADLSLESEAALHFAMRCARALDAPEDAGERLLLRLMTPVGKYWICKRTPQHAYEAMECIGGSGVMEDSPMPRLFRESPVNAIWEGSGNIQCLDVLRVMQRSPQSLELYMQELEAAEGRLPVYDRYLDKLKNLLLDQESLEYRARDLVDRLALCLQASLLLREAPSQVSEPFCHARLDNQGTHQYGTLPAGFDLEPVLARHRPIG